MDVAVIGTGKMGSAMARRLHEQGFSLRLWNRTRSRAEAVGVGRVCDSVSEAIDGADVGITVLTDALAVRSVYADLIPAAGSCVLAELSTVDVATHRDIAQEAAKNNVAFVEAPVGGTIPVVKAGKLVILAAGDAEAIERARPVLEALGSVDRVGAIGAGIQLKLIANAALAITSVATAELLHAAREQGVDEERTWEILVRFIPHLGIRRDGFIERIYEPPMFRLTDMLKDIDLALTEFEQARMPLLNETRKEFEAAVPEHGEKDLAAIGERFRATREKGSA